MQKKTDPTQEGIRHLKKIEDELSEIKENTGSWQAWFVRGVLQGAGIIIGTIAAVILVGWTLSILGLLPGFSEIADYLRSVTERIDRF